jgi:hypothetical protein
VMSVVAAVVMDVIELVMGQAEVGGYGGIGYGSGGAMVEVVEVVEMVVLMKWKCNGSDCDCGSGSRQIHASIRVVGKLSHTRCTESA